MKKDKRIARQQAREEKQRAKQPAEVEKILLKGKEPVSVAEVEIQKIPPSAEPKQTGGIFSATCIVNTSIEDRSGEWSWGVARDWHVDPGREQIDNFLRYYNKVKTWREIFEEKTVGKQEVVKPKHVKYDTCEICTEANNRLIDLKLDDNDEIFRFRMSNRERLYGFLFGNVFSTVWYDPTHDIYPTSD